MPGDTTTVVLILATGQGGTIEGSGAIGATAEFRVSGEYSPPVVYLRLTHDSGARGDFVGEIHQSDLMQGQMTVGPAQTLSGNIWLRREGM